MDEKKNSLISQEIELLLIKGTRCNAYPEVSDLPRQNNSSKRHKFNIEGVLYATFAAFIVAVGNCIKKSIPNVPVYQMLCLRTIYAMIPILAILILKKQTQELRESMTIKIFVIGLYRSLCNICYFSALIGLSGSEVVTIFSINSLVVGLLAAFFLHEAYTNLEKVLGLVSFGGVLLIVRPPFLFGTETQLPTAAMPEMSRYFAGILTILSLLFHAANIIAIRALNLKFSAWIVGFHMQLNGFIVFGLYMLFTGSYHPMTFNEHWGIFGSGMCGLVIIHCNVKAWQLEKPSVTAVIQYSGLIFSLLLDILILAEFPSYLTCIGAALIVGSCLYLVKVKSQNEK